jgi:hypothetical protein
MDGNETLPEFAAQFLFVLLLAGVMFGLGFVFRPMSRRRRVKRAARAGA